MRASEGQNLGILNQFLNQQRQPQRFAPSQTAQMMMAQSGQARGGGGSGGTGIGIEPPILGGNTTDARVNWASHLGRFDAGYTPHEMSWLWNMMGGPMSFHNNPWGGYSNLTSGWANTQPITGDVNVLGGSRHMGQRRNK